ncbi:MAG: hypothetical protein WCS65_03950 [Verrucomicrobiae bacterium]
MEEGGGLEKWANTNVLPSLGPFIKLMRHVKTGIVADFFACSEKTWWNNFTLRSGGKDSNMAVVMAARARELKWNSTGEGFTKLSNGSNVFEGSEEDAFQIVGLPCLLPEKRL